MIITKKDYEENPYFIEGLKELNLENTDELVKDIPLEINNILEAYRGGFFDKGDVVVFLRKYKNLFIN